GRRRSQARPQIVSQSLRLAPAFFLCVLCGGLFPRTPTLDGFPAAVPLSHAHPGIGASDLPRKLDLSTTIPRIRSTSGAERPIPWVDSIQRRDPEILASSMTDRPRILFLCTANACRSQIAQGLLEVLAPD